MGKCEIAGKIAEYFYTSDFFESKRVPPTKFVALFIWSKDILRFYLQPRYAHFGIGKKFNKNVQIQKRYKIFKHYIVSGGYLALHVTKTCL